MPLHQPLARSPHRAFVPAPAGRWGWAVALGLHAAACWWAWSLKSQPPAPAPAPVVVWWQAQPIGPTTPSLRPSAATRPTATTPTPAQATPRPPQLGAEALTDSSTGLPSGAERAPLAEVQGTTTAAAPQASAAAVASAASAASAPLKLTLPAGLATRRPSEVHAALNDARSNSPTKTLASRLASVMGDGRWSMEDLGDGRKRYRRGAQCIETRPARSNQIDPFNAGFRNAPDLVGDC